MPHLPERHFEQFLGLMGEFGKYVETLAAPTER